MNKKIFNSYFLHLYCGFLFNSDRQNNPFARGFVNQEPNPIQDFDDLSEETAYTSEEEIETDLGENFKENYKYLCNLLEKSKPKEKEQILNLPMEEALLICQELGKKRKNDQSSVSLSKKNHQEYREFLIEEIRSVVSTIEPEKMDKLLEKYNPGEKETEFLMKNKDTSLSSKIELLTLVISMLTKDQKKKCFNLTLGQNLKQIKFSGQLKDNIYSLKKTFESCEQIIKSSPKYIQSSDEIRQLYLLNKKESQNLTNFFKDIEKLQKVFVFITKIKTDSLKMNKEELEQKLEELKQLKSLENSGEDFSEITWYAYENKTNSFKELLSILVEQKNKEIMEWKNSLVERVNKEIERIIKPFDNMSA